MVSKKVLDLVLKIFVIEKSLKFGIEKIYQKSLGFLCFKHGFVKFGIGIGIGFKTCPIFLIVSDSASKIFCIEISIGFGIGKKLVTEKVSESVSKILRYRKKDSDSVSFRFWVSSHTDRY